MSLLPELRELAHRGEDYLYHKHDTNSATSLLIEMLHARRGRSHSRAELGRPAHRAGRCVILN